MHCHKLQHRELIAREVGVSRSVKAEDNANPAVIVKEAESCAVSDPRGRTHSR
jgi:hypothetical protein